MQKRDLHLRYLQSVLQHCFSNVQELLTQNPKSRRALRRIVKALSPMMLSQKEFCQSLYAIMMEMLQKL